MDHLWIDKQAQRPPEQVPILGQVVYDGLGVSGFLERHGMDEEKLIQVIFQQAYEMRWGGNDHNDSANESSKQQDMDEYFGALSIFQEWAFFGLLIDFANGFGVRIDREELIKKDEFEHSACTEALPAIARHVMIEYCNATFQSDHSAYSDPDLLERLQQAHALEPSSYAKEIARVTETILSRTTDFLRKSVAVRDASHVPEIPKLFWISAAAMTEAVAELGGLLLGPSLADFGDYQVSSGDADYFLFRDCGLCPSKFVTASTLTTSESYIAYLATRNLDKNHGDCTYRRCINVSSHVSESLPYHRKGCNGDCRMVSVHGARGAGLENSLEHGDFPIIEFTSTEGEDVSVKVHSSNNVDSYVALSHVWSHGLGNPYLNALPKCQLIFLKRTLSKESMPTCFWLDTLCVPLRNPWRRQAIRKMRETYQHAERVLVIDKQLLEIVCHDYLRLQSLALSDWMTRLWTLQEGLLAGKNLYIAFADGVKSLYDLIDDRRRLKLPLSTLMLPASVYHRLQQDFTYETPEADRLLAIAQTLHRRETSKAEDEALCLATICGINTNDLPMEKRPSLPDLFEVLDKQNVLQQDVLFTRGPRSADRGWRWSPLTFLNQGMPMWFRNTHGLAQLGRDGIRVQKDVTLLDGSPVTVQAIGQEGTQFAVLEEKDDSEIYAVTFVSLRDPSLVEDRSFELTDAGIIHHSRGLDEHAAVLISGVRRVGETLFGNYEALLCTAPHDDYLRMFGDYAERMPKYRGRLMQDQQVWVD